MAKRMIIVLKDKRKLMVTSKTIKYTQPRLMCKTKASKSKRPPFNNTENIFLLPFFQKFHRNVNFRLSNDQST